MKWDKPKKKRNLVTTHFNGCDHPDEIKSLISRIFHRNFGVFSGKLCVKWSWTSIHFLPLLFIYNIPLHSIFKNFESNPLTFIIERNRKKNGEGTQQTEGSSSTFATQLFFWICFTFCMFQYPFCTSSIYDSQISILGFCFVFELGFLYLSYWVFNLCLNELVFTSVLIDFSMCCWRKCFKFLP